MGNIPDEQVMNDTTTELTWEEKNSAVYILDLKRHRQDLKDLKNLIKKLEDKEEKV